MTTDRTNIRPEALAAAATTSAATQAARVPVSIPSPPPVSAGSPVDAAAVDVAVSIAALLAVRDAADVTAVTIQTTALNESPPELVQQDQVNAANIAAASTQFPLQSGGKV